jgi:hypothetical protein
MCTPVLLTALVASFAPLQADTVIPVERGTRLDVDNFRGEVMVDVWSRGAIRVQRRSCAAAR